MVYTHNGDLQWKGIRTQTTTWMNSEDIALSEVSQSQEDKYYMISLTGGALSSQMHKDKKYSGGCQVLWGGGNEENEELFFNEYSDSVL